ncbi:MAG TPA: pyridoxamine 5'-phosphate oxidase family protein [Pseudonocardiaceae bacterium]|nr:pyridoxamine 5'-phosphate oxidase family protein [Pseudonocardiaceae bacterium]
MVGIPESHRDLLEKPLLAHLATVRPDGTPQSNPMWFGWDGEVVRFTSTTTRQKYRNMVANPAVAFSSPTRNRPTAILRCAARWRISSRIRMAAFSWNSPTAIMPT